MQTAALLTLPSVLVLLIQFLRPRGDGPKALGVLTLCVPSPQHALDLRIAFLLLFGQPDSEPSKATEPWHLAGMGAHI